MSETRETRPVVQTRGDDMDGQFSPDGRFIAYQSDDGSGDHEIYIQRFPEPGQRVRVSTNGGSQVRWRRDVADSGVIVGVAVIVDNRAGAATGRNSITSPSTIG